MIETIRRIIKVELLQQQYNNNNNNTSPSTSYAEDSEIDLNLFVLQQLLQLEDYHELVRIALRSGKEELNQNVITILQLLHVVISSSTSTSTSTSNTSTTTKKKIFIPLCHLDRYFSLYYSSIDYTDFQYLNLLLKYSSNTKTILKYIFPSTTLSPLSQLEELSGVQLECLIGRYGNYKLQQQFKSTRRDNVSSSSSSSSSMDDVIQHLIQQQPQQQHEHQSTLINDSRLSRQLQQLQSLRLTTTSATSTSTINARESIIPPSSVTTTIPSRLDRQLQQLKSLRV
jgi:hypothetical protein